jgi:hypothetical protein
MVAIVMLASIVAFERQDAPIIVRDIKFAGENGPWPELQVDDFILKAQVHDYAEFNHRVNNLLKLGTKSMTCKDR